MELDLLLSSIPSCRIGSCCCYCGLLVDCQLCCMDHCIRIAPGCRKLDVRTGLRRDGIYICQLENHVDYWIKYCLSPFSLIREVLNGAKDL